MILVSFQVWHRLNKLGNLFPMSEAWNRKMFCFQGKSTNWRKINYQGNLLRLNFTNEIWTGIKYVSILLVPSINHSIATFGSSNSTSCREHSFQLRKVNWSEFQQVRSQRTQPLNGACRGANLHGRVYSVAARVNKSPSKKSLSTSKNHSLLGTWLMLSGGEKSLGSNGAQF